MSALYYKLQDHAFMWQGTVSGIYLAEEAEAPMISLAEAHLVEGRGIEGDRYYKGVGTHCDNDDDEPWYEVTLIESETIHALRREKKMDLDAGMPRRNIVTKGFALNHLVHRTFRIGEAILRGQALREPCPNLADTTSRALMIGLIHRGGLGAQILRSGIIRVGDVIEEVRVNDGKLL
ncbi:MAG: MOSC domain-containing protein [Ktedonobacteraceae bacterium]